MDFTAVYPKIEPRPNIRLILRRVTQFALLIGCLTSCIINLCLGGFPWALLVLGGAMVFWALFLHHPLVEYTLIEKASTSLFWISVYLVLIDVLTDGPNWSRLVVPIVLFSVFFLILLLYFIRFRQQKHNIFPLYRIFVFSLGAIALASCNVFSMTFSWPIIVLASLDVVLLILTVFFFRKPIAAEFRKKFHLK